MRRPRVLIAALAGVQGGPRTYALSLARALPRVAPDLEYVWLSEVPPGPIPGVTTRTIRLPHPTLRPVWDHLAVPGAIRRWGTDLYHNTKNCLPLRGAGPSVVTIHDLAPFTRPETFGGLSRTYLTLHIRHAAETADAVIAVSMSTKRDLVEILGVEPDRVHVVMNGVEDRYFRPPEPAGEQVRARHSLPPRYALFAGTLQPRKNPDVVLEAYLGLPAELREEVALVFAGRTGWKHGPFRERLARAQRTENVRHLDDVPDADMPGLYAGAEVFLSPSSYEGFGLTVAEAMAAGTAVIAGDGSSLPEVVGDAGLLVPARDPEAVREALAGLLEDGERRAALAAAGRERARRFTWERAARETAEVYRLVL